MTDHARIYVSRRGHALTEYGMGSRRQGDLLTPQKALAIHQESQAFLETELAQTSWDKTMIVTHHAPSALSLTYQKSASKIDATYASNLDALVEQADLWIHDHTHIPAAYRIGSGRVVSNPRGYGGSALVAEFDPALVLDI